VNGKENKDAAGTTHALAAAKTIAGFVAFWKGVQIVTS